VGGRRWSSDTHQVIKSVRRLGVGIEITSQRLAVKITDCRTISKAYTTRGFLTETRTSGKTAVSSGC
jgi:hypothetical protein